MLRFMMFLGLMAACAGGFKEAQHQVAQGFTDAFQPIMEALQND